MKLLLGRYTNFCSYSSLEVDFSSLGLACIYGETGAGKSTLMDMPCWCLFGITSKGGSVDEVRSWFSTGTTEGEQSVQCPGGKIITVVRVRGGGAKNDLYWIEDGYTHRGKDITETQKLLELCLGVTSELYLLSSYLSQFSEVGNFFIAKAKDRREVLEKIVDLSFPIHIGEASSECKKEIKNELKSLELEEAKIIGRLDASRKTLQQRQTDNAAYDLNKCRNILDLKEKSLDFDTSKEAKLSELEKKIEVAEEGIANVEPLMCALLRAYTDEHRVFAKAEEREDAVRKLAKSEVMLAMLEREHERFSASDVKICPTCLGDSDNDNKKAHVEELAQKILIHGAVTSEWLAKVESLAKEFSVWETAKVSREKKLREYETELSGYTTASSRAQDAYLHLESEVNNFAYALESLKAEVNPHSEAIAQLLTQIEATEVTKAGVSASILDAKTKITAYGQLYDLSLVLRGKLLQDAVDALQGATNKILEDSFDAEIKVAFQLDSDKIEVSLQKNGYDCSFRQLSGGQRCMLKLAFSLSLMEAAANKAGVHFNTIFLDEPLYGLSPDLKVKAFSLFQHLQNLHESVLVIEHAPEFQAQFDTSVAVTLEGDESQIEVKL